MATFKEFLKATEIIDEINRFQLRRGHENSVPSDELTEPEVGDIIHINWESRSNPKFATIKANNVTYVSAEILSPREIVKVPIADLQLKKFPDEMEKMLMKISNGQNTWVKLSERQKKIFNRPKNKRNQETLGWLRDIQTNTPAQTAMGPEHSPEHSDYLAKTLGL